MGKQATEKNAGRYEAYVHFNGKKHYFGLHETAYEAAVARDKGAKVLFGEFVNLNILTQAAC